jgi:hypothetical protein
MLQNKKYKAVFFDSFIEVFEKKEQILELCAQVDQLNIVIKSEGDMDDPKILNIHPKIKIYAGAAWWLIHDRRTNEGWYPTL